MVVVVSYDGGVSVLWWLWCLMVVGCVMVVEVSYGGGVLWWLWYRIYNGRVGVLSRTL